LSYLRGVISDKQQFYHISIQVLRFLDMLKFGDICPQGKPNVSGGKKYRDRTEGSE
jgi:hypothetical protein